MTVLGTTKVAYLEPFSFFKKKTMQESLKPCTETESSCRVDGSSELFHASGGTCGGSAHLIGDMAEMAERGAWRGIGLSAVSGNKASVTRQLESLPLIGLGWSSPSSDFLPRLSIVD